MTTTYVATAPDGSKHTRKTDRTYSQAVLIEGSGPRGAEWRAVGFCGRPDLAEKKRREHPGSIVVECGVIGDHVTDLPEVKAAENPEPTAPISDNAQEPKHTISRLIEKLLMDGNLGYAAIVDQVVTEFPDAKTTTRSVASVAAMLRKKGTPVPTRRKSSKS